MPSVDKSSHRPQPTVIKHYHENKPVVYPYKPPAKGPPPGAHLYKDVWNIFRVATHVFLCAQGQIPYLAGFTVGALKAGYDWSEKGPPKSITADAESIDFGATAHTTTLMSQISILGESFLAIAIPTFVDTEFFEERLNHHFPPLFASGKVKDLTPIAQDQGQALYLAEQTGRVKTTIWPTTWPQLFKWTWIGIHGVKAGEEIVQRFAQWIDAPKEKKK